MENIEVVAPEPIVTKFKRGDMVKHKLGITGVVAQVFTHGKAKDAPEDEPMKPLNVFVYSVHHLNNVGEIVQSNFEEDLIDLCV